MTVSLIDICDDMDNDIRTDDNSRDDRNVYHISNNGHHDVHNYHSNSDICDGVYNDARDTRKDHDNHNDVRVLYNNVCINSFFYSWLDYIPITRSANKCYRLVWYADYVTYFTINKLAYLRLYGNLATTLSILIFDGIYSAVKRRR